MDKFTCAIVAGVLALVVTGVAAAAVLRGHAAAPDLATPGGVVLAYALAEQHGDGQAAWDLLAEPVRLRMDRERFLASVGTALDDRAYLTTDDERLDGTGASVVLVRTYPSAGLLAGDSSTGRTRVRLAREAAGWRITAPPDAYRLTPATR